MTSAPASHNGVVSGADFIGHAVPAFSLAKADAEDAADPKPHPATDPDLDRHVSAATAFAQILHAGIAHLHSNRPAALSGDAEGVHQMRVAVRRLRAALALFGPHLEPHAAGRFQSELRRTGQVLGEARDWDVFCLDLLPSLEKDAQAAPWCELLKRPAAEQRRAAHERLAQEVRGPGFAALVRGLEAWAAQARAEPDLLGDKDLARPLKRSAPEMLDRLARKARRRGRHLGRRADAERHALRKALKKLRYGIDFVGSLYPHARRKRYLRRCKHLQELLGTVNDAATATVLAGRLSAGAHADLAPASGAVAQRFAQERDKAVRDLGKAWDDFRDEPRFWA